MDKELNALFEQRKAKNDEVALIFEKQDATADANGENMKPLTDDEVQRVKTLNKEIEEIEAKVSQKKEWIDQRAAVQRRKDAYRTPAEGIPGEGGKATPEIKSIADRVMQNEEFKAFLAEMSNKRTGKIGSSPVVSLLDVALKTLITGASSTSGGALIVNDRTPIVDQGVSYRDITLFDLIPVEPTISDTVEFVREGTHTNNAAGVTEASATGDGSGAKPESAMALSVVSSPVQTVAHWIPATRQALSDANRLRSLIENFLMYGVKAAFETGIATGNGTAPAFTGILNYSGTTAQAWSTNILTTTRKARTKVRTTGRGKPTAFALHPNDWETIDLLQDNEARYFFGGPSVIGTPRLWGLPVVESEAVTEGYGICADWSRSRIWDREQTSIYVSDSHSDFFTRNMIAILAEMRAAFDLIRPAAFVVADLTA